MERKAIIASDPVAVEIVTEVQREEAPLEIGALQSAHGFRDRSGLLKPSPKP